MRTLPPQSEIFGMFGTERVPCSDYQYAVLRESFEAAQAAQAEFARLQRDGLLKESDWVVSRSAELGQPIPAEWAAYRQALRDLPLQEDFPDVIQWPEKPA